VDQLTVVEPDTAVAAATQPERARRDDVEDRLGIGLGTADSAQHFARGRLPSESAGQVGIPGLQLLEQPDVLDGDDSLVGKRLKERDLLRRERAHLYTPNHDDSDRTPFAQQGGR
jgi:hypothetical protein